MVAARIGGAPSTAVLGLIGRLEAGSSAMEYAQEMFAQSLSANGGLGMASLVMKGLKPPDEP